MRRSSGARSGWSSGAASSHHLQVIRGGAAPRSPDLVAASHQSLLADRASRLVSTRPLEVPAPAPQAVAPASPRPAPVTQLRLLLNLLPSPVSSVLHSQWASGLLLLSRPTPYPLSSRPGWSQPLNRSRPPDRPFRGGWVVGIGVLGETPGRAERARPPTRVNRRTGRERDSECPSRRLERRRQGRPPRPLNDTSVGIAASRDFPVGDSSASSARGRLAAVRSLSAGRDLAGGHGVSFPCRDARGRVGSSRRRRRWPLVTSRALHARPA